jgi:uncharacterized protein YbjT (DUF2867 family)
MFENRKAIPNRVLIFGAAGHIGRPLAYNLSRESPSIRLRLSTSSAGKAASLRTAFPNAEVVDADYRDLASLHRAVEGMEGIFVVAPTGTDEAVAMTNLVAALRGSDTLVHLIRMLGMQPEANLNRIPSSLRDHGLGLPVQHPIAKRILDASGLPVTYLNSGATFIDNFLRNAAGLRNHRTLVWPERLIPFIDTNDIAEVAARILLSDNHRHIGQFHTMNNGQDILRFSEIAELMSEVWGVPIIHDPSREAFFEAYAVAVGRDKLSYLWDFFEYERDNEVVWARNDFVERTLGRKPMSVRQWLIDHRAALLGEEPSHGH